MPELAHPTLRPRRRRINGQLRRVKRPMSARNARPKKLHVLHGGSSSLRTAKLDGRSAMARSEKQFVAALVADLHRAPSTWERSLFQLAARLESMSKLARLHIEKDGTLNPGAATALVQASRELITLSGEGVFTPPKADISALRQAQAEALRQLSNQALEALLVQQAPGSSILERHPTRPVAPLREGSSANVGPDYPARQNHPATAPLLLLPAPAAIRPRINKRPPKPPLPRDQWPIVEKGGPGFHVVKPKDVQVVTDQKPEVAVERWDSPWRMR